MARIGATILWYERVGSTNDVARDLAAGGSPEGVVVAAREQTDGRGRQGKTWESRPDEGLYFSVILRPRIQALEAPILTLGAAVAVAETLNSFGAPTDIKWPNDIMVRGRKICGILAESAIAERELQYAILGVGVNLRQRQFPTAIAETATSLYLECGAAVSPDEFLEPLLTRLDYWLPQTTENQAITIARWEQMSAYAHNCRIRVLTTEGGYEAVTRGLAASGALVIELDSGETREIVAGQISLRAAT